MRILYIDIDSLRPDHLGCYGYHRNTSPAIDAIAQDGTVFRKAYASDAPCLPSRTALYSGRFGIQTGVTGHGGTAANPKLEGCRRSFRDNFDTQGFARQLQLLGHHTAMISPFGQRHAAWHFYAGFNEIHNTGQGGMESAEVVQPIVDKWLAENARKENWYLHINYWDPHTPYRTPAEAGNPFANDPLPEWLNDEELISSHNKLGGPHTSLDVSMYSDIENPGYPRQPGKITDAASLRRMIDGYDVGVNYVDQQIAGIVAMLKTAGIYDETAIIISADHGENMGELGIYGEHGTADEATCHIPMIIKWPGGLAGATDEGLHYHLDLVPTIMNLLGGAVSELWDGKSFSRTITKGEEAGRDSLVISQCAHVCQRSVRWDDWLYMRTYHDGFHLFPQEMLFDLKTDPHEQTNIAQAHPDICHEGQWRLSGWHDEQMQRMARNANDATDPLWTVIKEGGPYHARLASGRPLGNPGSMTNFKKYLHRLEETGRKEAAEELRKKYAWEIEQYEPTQTP